MELGAGEGALARGLDLAVRLPPLYLMDMILIQVISHAHFLRRVKTTILSLFRIWEFGQNPHCPHRHLSTPRPYPPT